MSRDKQIDEMCRVLCQNAFCSVEDWADCTLRNGFCGRCKMIAQTLYANGYRKASDVEREILAEVREFYMRDDRYAALERSVKKKYESEGADDEIH